MDQSEWNPYSRSSDKVPELSQISGHLYIKKIKIPQNMNPWGQQIPESSPDTSQHK